MLRMRFLTVSESSTHKSLTIKSLLAFMAMFLGAIFMANALENATTKPCACDTELERAALLELYDSLGGANWTNQTGWSTNASDLSTWYGVTMFEGCVRSLYLDGNNLSGVIPTEIGNLTNLGTLNLAGNQLSGIPTEIGNLTNLLFLVLNNNQLSGSILAQMGNMASLITVSLANNQLTGTIPTELGNLMNLTILDLFNNQLIGTIPTELSNLTNLTTLALGGNQLTGTIPTQLGNLMNLQVLALNNNQLTGTIPIELGNLINLQYLYLNDTQLSGSIPTQLGNLTNLADLYLNDTQLSGSLPLEFVNLVNITYQFNFSNTNLCVPQDEAFSSWLDLIVNTNGATVTSSNLLCPIVLVAGQLGARTVQISWTNIAGETGYQIQRASDMEFTQNLATFEVNANIATYEDTSVSPGTSYHYRVRAILPE
jgi:Leucine-rich repeat (LRR) protein